MNEEKRQQELKKLMKKYIKIFLPFILGSITVATHYFAYVVKFHKMLGGIKIPRILMKFFPIQKIYFPFAYLFWRKQYFSQVPKLIKKIDNFLISIFIGVFLLFLFILRKKQEITVHGSAKWASQEEIKKMELYQETGVVLGCDSKGNILRDNGDKHIIMCAPTRGGKGINTVTPTALDCITSIVFNDIKGELWDLTAGYRKRVLGQKVFMFCPVDTTGVSCAYNGLDYVAIGTLHEYEDVSVISQTLIDTEGKGESDHWISSAINLINGVILHVKYAKPNASLVDVIQFLTPTHMSLVDQIADILGVPRENEENELGVAVRNGCADSFEEQGNDDGTDYYDKLGECCFDHLQYFEDKDLFKKLHNAKPTRTDKYCRLNPTVAREFMSFYNTPDKERGSILSTATQKLKIFLDPMLTPLISHSDFTIRQLMEEKCSLYLVTPPRAISRTRPLMRLIITQIVYQLTDRMSFKNKGEIEANGIFGKIIAKVKKYFQNTKKKLLDYIYPETKEKKNRILLLIDEFPALGKLSIVEEAMNYIAGFGLKCLLIAQSLKSLKKIYGKDNYIQDNCSIQLYLTPNDEETPKMISDMFDTYTEKVVSESRKGFELMPTRSTSYVARKLMTPGEVRSLPYEEILMLLTGQNPIHGKKLFYYKKEKYLSKLLEVPETSDRNPPKFILPNGYELFYSDEIKKIEEELSYINQVRKYCKEKRKYNAVSFGEASWKLMHNARQTMKEEKKLSLFEINREQSRREIANAISFEALIANAKGA
ncbi:MAG: type IV secretory system conjugative DNA transfer family protein [Fusobacterium necrophorum]|nr:type IV secretory system conjugative DNA transfer family protein [Fusobacterium necrophorum]